MDRKNLLQNILIIITIIILFSLVFSLFYNKISLVWDRGAIEQNIQEENQMDNPRDMEIFGEKIEGKKPEIVEVDEIVLGTVAEIKTFWNDEAKAREAIDDAYKEIERTRQIFDNYDNESDVSQLNAKKLARYMSVEITLLIRKSIEYSKLTNGSFDITIKPLLDTYRDSFAIYNRPPNFNEIAKALYSVGYENIEINDELIKLNRGASIDLGGIAKGYIIDRSVEAMKKKGITNGIVNIGGDLKVFNDNEKKEWRIALENPADKKEYITILSVRDKAVATSGNYERFFDKGKKVSHIMDPKTGKDAQGLISVTIITDNAIDADAMATGVFVMGKEKGLELVENMENMEALIITEDKEIFRSSGFEKYEVKE